MKQIRPNKIIISPILSEKSLVEQQSGKYSFWVTTSSNKNQVAQAFEQAFSIKPLSVNTILLKGKVKTDWKKRLPIVKQDRKKAIVTVKKDQKIELLNLSTQK